MGRPSAALALLMALATVVSGMPPWYQCDPATCKPPACMCASNFPPGGLAAATTPQFILVTHDDAVNAYSNKVVRSLTDGHLNANGCNVPATWYTLQTGSECEIVKRLWEQNHEIALHTQHHAPLVVNFQGDLKEEMLGVRAWLNTTCGIPLEEIVGFRAPYLVHNPAVRAVEAAAGLLYDASMIETFSADSLVETAPGQRVWPFTMDAGIPIDCNWNYPDGQCNGTTERYPGLWEVPLWELQNAAGEHLFTMDPAGDVYSILVDNFNMNYGGNRAPFGIFLHATWFTPENTAAANRFLAWALAQPDVWAVTTRQLLDWMRAPVPAAQMASWLTCAPVNLSDTPGDTPCQLYTVRIGDSSYSVATQFAVLTDDFLALNPDLGDGSRLAVDQQVKIPPWDATCVGAAVLAVTAPGVPAVPGAAGAPAAAPGPAAPPCRTYAVAAGDYWHAVADKFAVAVNDLVQANPGLAADTTLTAGSTLRIPPYPMTCSTPGAAQPATGEDPPAPASGLNATMRLAGRTQASFQTELEAPFVAAVARALGVPPADVELVDSKPVLAPAARRLAQADAPPVVDVTVRAASTDPAGLYANATAALVMGGPFDTKVLSTYGLAMMAAPVLVPFWDGVPMEVGGDGSLAATAPAPSAATADGGDSGLSTGVIVGVAVGGAVAVAAAAAALAVCWRRRAKTRRGAEVERAAAAGELEGFKAAREEDRLTTAEPVPAAPMSAADAGAGDGAARAV